MLSATDRYIARLIAWPLLGSLVIAAMLLVLDKMLRLFDFVAAEGGPVSVVWRMLANLVPEYLSLGIPIGLMLGILLAFRRLALSSELDVLQAVGLSHGRLLRVPYMRSEEHTSELQSLMRISYAVFCLKKKNNKQYN